MVEYERLVATGTAVERAVLRQEILELLKRAAQGRCTYGPASQGGNVEQMGAAQSILELRLGWWPGDVGVQNLVRLYFCEPDHIPGCLYAAKLASKCPGPLGLAEQTRHAREAAKRVDLALARS